MAHLFSAEPNATEPSSTFTIHLSLNSGSTCFWMNLLTSTTMAASLFCSCSGVSFSSRIALSTLFMKSIGCHPLAKGLLENSLGLGHYSLDCAAHHDGAVHCAHRLGHVRAEVHVAWRVEKVDEISLSLIVVGHRDSRAVDCHQSLAFLVVDPRKHAVSDEILSHQSCGRG